MRMLQCLRLIFLCSPKLKSGKCWAYDISHGYTFPSGQLSVPIGGKPVMVNLNKSYTFSWEKFGSLWFTEIEGLHASHSSMGTR
jgi:hypothetical protein